MSLRNTYFTFFQKVQNKKFKVIFLKLVRATDWEKVFANCISDKDWYPKYTKKTPQKLLKLSKENKQLNLKMGK